MKQLAVPPVIQLIQSKRKSDIFDNLSTINTIFFFAVLLYRIVSTLF